MTPTNLQSSAKRFSLLLLKTSFLKATLPEYLRAAASAAKAVSSSMVVSFENRNGRPVFVGQPFGDDGAQVRPPAPGLPGLPAYARSMPMEQQSSIPQQQAVPTINSQQQNLPLLQQQLNSDKKLPHGIQNGQTANETANSSSCLNVSSEFSSETVAVKAEPSDVKPVKSELLDILKGVKSSVEAKESSAELQTSTEIDQTTNSNPVPFTSNSNRQICEENTPDVSGKTDLVVDRQEIDSEKSKSAESVSTVAAPPSLDIEASSSSAKNNCDLVENGSQPSSDSNSTCPILNVQKESVVKDAPPTLPMVEPVQKINGRVSDNPDTIEKVVSEPVENGEAATQTLNPESNNAPPMSK